MVTALVSVVLYYYYNNVISVVEISRLDDDDPDRGSAGIFRKCYLNSNGETHAGAVGAADGRGYSLS